MAEASQDDDAPGSVLRSYAHCRGLFAMALTALHYDFTCSGLMSRERKALEIASKMNTTIRISSTM